MSFNPNTPPSSTPEGRLMERLAQLEKRLDRIDAHFNGGATAQLPVVDTLPTAGREGRLVKVTGGGVFYDTGTAWSGPL